VLPGRAAGAAGCRAIDLDSGLSRVDAHRFYMREGMAITSSHLARSLAWSSVELGSGAAGCGPQVDVALLGVAVDLRKFLGVEIEPLQGGDVLLELLNAARPEQR